MKRYIALSYLKGVITHVQVVAVYLLQRGSLNVATGPLSFLFLVGPRATSTIRNKSAYSFANKLYAKFGLVA